MDLICDKKIKKTGDGLNIKMVYSSLRAVILYRREITSLEANL